MSEILIVGLGSVGLRHLAAAIELGYSVVGVDPKPLSFLDDEIQPMEVHQELASLHGRHFEYCAIANWGPDHVSTLYDVYQAGLCSKFIIEKPLCGSFGDLRKMHKLVEAEEIEFILSFPRRYMEFTNYVSENTDGSPTSISVWGGAQCISTTGSHWLDVAIDLFGFPNSVMANLQSEQINPRSASLDFFEGTASYSFSNGRKLDLSFDNKSWVSSSARVLFRDGILEIQGDGEVHVAEVEERLVVGTPVTRTRYPRVSRTLSLPASMEQAFLGMHRRIAKGSITRSEMLHDLRVSGWLLLTFESNEERKSLGGQDLSQLVENSSSSWKIS